MGPDRYRRLERVADGPGWELWHGRDDVLDRDVGVLAVAADHPHADDVARAARAAACVGDTAFLHVYDVVEDADGVRVVREWAAGSTLPELLAGGPLPVDEACVLGIQVARALSAAEAAGLGHGAVGPADVRRTDDGRTLVAGLAVRAALDPAAARPGPVAEADAWAVAAVTYAALTGTWPGPGGDGLPTVVPPPRARQVRPEVPRDLDRTLAQALDRPAASPADVGHRLEAVLRVIGRRTGDRPPAQRGSGTGRWRAVAAALAVVGALGAAAWWGLTLAGTDLTGPDAPGAGSPAPRSNTSPGAVSPTTSPSLSPSQPGVTGRVEVVAGADFDPRGNGEENPDEVPLAFDGSLATAWTTVSYERADLAPKPGVGVVFDLGAVETVGAVRLDLVGAGTSVEVLTAAELPGDGPASARTRRDFEPFGSGTNVGEIVALRAAAPVQARYVLVWLTALPADGDTYRGGIAEITVARN